MNPRFGLFFLPTLSGGTQAREKLSGLLELIQQGDRLGFSHAWFAEHHLSSYGGLIPSPAILCAAAGATTRRIRLGSCAVILPFHDPVVVAEEFALLDVLTEGRIDLGIGRGFVPFEKARFTRPGDQSEAALTRHIGTIIDCWSQRCRMGHPTRTQPELSFSLHQEPHPPVWLAISNSRDNARTAGTQGFGLMLNPYTRTADELRSIRSAYAEGWREGGRSWDQRRILAHFFLYLSSDPDAVMGEAKPQLELYLSHLDAALDIGSPDVRHFPTSFGQLYPERVFMGTPAEIAPSLHGWVEWGVTDFAFSVSFGDLPVSSAANTMRLFADAFMGDRCQMAGPREGGVREAQPL